MAKILQRILVKGAVTLLLVLTFVVVSGKASHVFAKSCPPGGLYDKQIAYSSQNLYGYTFAVTLYAQWNCYSNHFTGNLRAFSEIWQAPYMEGGLLVSIVEDGYNSQLNSFDFPNAGKYGGYISGYSPYLSARCADGRVRLYPGDSGPLDVETNRTCD